MLTLIQSIKNALKYVKGNANIDTYILQSKSEIVDFYAEKEDKNDSSILSNLKNEIKDDKENVTLKKNKMNNNNNKYEMESVCILSAVKNLNEDEKIKEKNDIKDSDTIFNSGIIGNVYTNVETGEITLYIAKIDTSGWENLPRGMGEPSLSLIKAILLGWLSYYQNIYQNTTIPVTLHLFTRAKPNYIFPTSDDAEGCDKHVLTDSELICWWLKTLAHYPSLFHPAHGYWYCPTGERIGWKQTIANDLGWGVPIHNNLDKKKEIEEKPIYSKTSVCPWTWGYPYDKQDLAYKVIPLFPDDPKASLILGGKTGTTNKRASLIHNNTTVAQFFEYLALENFAGTVSACIIVHINDPKKNTNSMTTSASNKNITNESRNSITTSEKDKVLSKNEYDELMKYILNLNYAKTEDASNSSSALHQKINSFVEKKKVTYFQYNCHNIPKKLNNETTSNEHNVNLLSPQTTMNIQGLVKRKEKINETASPINNIQGLIRKKKINNTPSELSSPINNIQSLVKKRKINTDTSEKTISLPSKSMDNNSVNNIQNLIKRKKRN